MIIEYMNYALDIKKQDLLKGGWAVLSLFKEIMVTLPGFMNKARILCILISVMLLFSGCAYDGIPEEDLESWSEYLAYQVLNNEDNYKWKLITEEPEADELSKPADAADINNDDKAGSTEGNEDAGNEDLGNEDSGNEIPSIIGNAKYNEQFTDLLGYSGLTIEYDSYNAVDKLSDGLIEIEAGDGYEYYTVYFKLTNNSSKSISVNLSDMKISYQLQINISSVYKARINLLTNDIRFLDTAIKAGEIYIANASFLVPKGTEVNTLEAVIKIGDQSLIYKLK